MQKLWLALPGVLLACLLSACSVNPPVQEMSNARQTIQSAYEAKAQRYAPKPLKAAENLLKRATTALDAGDYPAARRYAIKAQQQAIKARQQAITHRNPE